MSSVALAGCVPLAGVTIDLDPFGAWFVLVAGVVIVAAAVYGIGYCDHALAGAAVQGMFPLFAATLVLVPAAGSVSTFLVLWELMAMTSLCSSRPSTANGRRCASATVWYGVMTQPGFVAVLFAFGLAARPRGERLVRGDSRWRACVLAATRASIVFVLALVGFGSKAGVVPLHVWLPRAHPEAPSHVSALMSGAMVSLGVYGVVRVGCRSARVAAPAGGDSSCSRSVASRRCSASCTRSVAQRPEGVAGLFDDREHGARSSSVSGRRCS